MIEFVMWFVLIRRFGSVLVIDCVFVIVFGYVFGLIGVLFVGVFIYVGFCCGGEGGLVDCFFYMVNDIFDCVFVGVGGKG